MSGLLCFSARRQTANLGMAYIMVLFVILILSMLGMALVYRMQVRGTAIDARLADMQAQYSAESATHEAIWRMLHDPNYPVQDNNYDMKSFAGTRYGYVTLKPGGTATFTGVSGIGAVGTVVAKQSYVQRVLTDLRSLLIVYRNPGDKAPDYRTLLNEAFSAAAPAKDLNAESLKWVHLEACPIRNEMMMASLTATNRVQISKWDGSSWANPYSLSNPSVSTSDCFDIAYESLSGDALAIGRDGTSSTTKYATWNGTTWTSSASGPSADGSPTLVRMKSNPASDEILAVLLDTAGADRLTLARWDGTSFPVLSENLDNNIQDGNLPGVDIAYEQLSGRGMIVWGNDSDSCRSRIWDGTTLNAKIDLPSFGVHSSIVRAEAAPGSNYIAMIGEGTDKSLNLAIWDGSSWIAWRKLENTATWLDRVCFDLEWDALGENLLVVWTGSTTAQPRVSYFFWNKNTALTTGAPQSGPSIGSGTVSLVRLKAISGPGKIVLGISNTALRLCYSIWDGASFVSDPAITIESTLLGSGEVPFALQEGML